MIDSLSAEDCDKFLAFCADPKIPSREKVAIRRPFGDFREVGDVKSLFVTIESWGEEMSISNLSRDIEKCLMLPEVELGEFP